MADGIWVDQQIPLGRFPWGYVAHVKWENKLNLLTMNQQQIEVLRSLDGFTATYVGILVLSHIGATSTCCSLWMMQLG